jgi:hypothetical protein
LKQKEKSFTRHAFRLLLSEAKVGDVKIRITFTFVTSRLYTPPLR